MNSQTEPSTILEMLAKNEECVGELYTKYAENFVPLRVFWSGLAEEERLHATWIRLLKQMVLDGKMSLEPDRFNSAAISQFSHNIATEITQTKQLGNSLVNALATAMDIEENLIESQYFTALEADSPDLQRILRDLQTATADHRQKLQETYAAYAKNKI